MIAKNKAVNRNEWKYSFVSSIFLLKVISGSDTKTSNCEAVKAIKHLPATFRKSVKYP